MHIALLSLEFSFTIEVIQLIFRIGVFDIDDLFLNTFGGMLGGLGYFICHKLFYKATHRRGKQSKYEANS